MVKRRQRQHLGAKRDGDFTEVRPAYSVYPDDDMYGSPRSWSGAILTRSTEDTATTGTRPSATAFSHEVPSRHLSPGDRRPNRSRFPQQGDPERSSPWGPQLLGAFFLVGASFLFFHSDKPLAQVAKHEISLAFTKDFTSIDLPPAVARVFGTLPSSGVAQPVVALPPLDVVTPLRGHIVQAYTKWSPDVIIDGRPGSPVVAASDGLVDSAGESQANGFYVTIDHGSFGQTVYAHLGMLRVRAHEYVTAGQVIGYMPVSSGKLTFGYIRGGSYQNPELVLHAAKQ